MRLFSVPVESFKASPGIHLIEGKFSWRKLVQYRYFDLKPNFYIISTRMDQNPDPHLAKGKAGADTNPRERQNLDPEFSKTSGSGHKKIFKKQGKA
jgi:hypothetical protein